MTSDLTYTQDKMFTRFMPNTTAGEDAWRSMASHDASGCAAVLNAHAEATINQLRAAGYSVSKAPKPKKLTQDDIYTMLGELGL